MPSNIWPFPNIRAAVTASEFPGCFPGCVCDACKRSARKVEFDAEMARYGFAVERRPINVFHEALPAMEGTDADHPVATKREKVAERVRGVLADLADPDGATADQAGELKRAAEKCIANHGLRGAIGKL